MGIVILAWVLGFIIPDLLGLTELLMMSKVGIIKGHLFTQVYTNLVRVLAVFVLFLLTRLVPADVFLIPIFTPLPLLILIGAALALAFLLIPKRGIKVLTEIRFYYQKTGRLCSIFIFNRYLLHICQIVLISFMVMILNRSLNPILSGLIAGGLWASLDLLLRNYRFGIYNLLLSVILSFSYSQFGSFSLNILIGILPQII
ncbi:hypothetical protein DRP53_06255 [candidate division WOR-3 bacterium]|uniref:Uncharacterized protein n=1 Tax=candidate division WOR-3 bacterium TaxID=2052148 RepID=A0A660SJ49_UNCW3|nr:MAG: hypothetical protein DRP53_06255 [candidate division WOR-3 bacterium]